LDLVEMKNCDNLFSEYVFIFSYSQVAREKGRKKNERRRKVRVMHQR
jgi:hypothetical protein